MKGLFVLKKNIISISLTLCLAFVSYCSIKYFPKQNHNDIHSHHHVHSGSSHSHSHTHVQITISMADFLLSNDNQNDLALSLSKQNHFNTVAYIPTPIIESLFRPPIS